MSASILVVDDEQDFLDSVVRMLRLAGHEDVVPVSSASEVPALLERRRFDLAVLDITMPEIDGIELLRHVKERHPQTECIMVTAHESVPLVVKSMRYGAYDYLVKPLHPERLAQSLERALERNRLLRSLWLKSREGALEALHSPEAFRDIVTADDTMLRLLHESELHASSTIPVLITGETGVGKELLARAIHAASGRREGPFVAVNMLSLSPTLFESEFFGHARGAFTGADRDKKGYLAQAEGGTLFLDEIGDLRLDIQGKMLRIFQEGEYVPVGKAQPQKADVRFVAATNQNLHRQVQQGQFRKDLFYRLQYAHLHLPPLRARLGDVPILAERFLARACRRGVRLSEDALRVLERHDWPGNVRELEGVLEAAANLAEHQVIEPQHLRLPAAKRQSRAPEATGEGEVELLEEVERRHILHAYAQLNENKTRTAKALGIGLQTLHRKLKAYGAR